MWIILGKYDCPWMQGEHQVDHQHRHLEGLRRPVDGDEKVADQRRQTR